MFALFAKTFGNRNCFIFLSIFSSFSGKFLTVFNNDLVLCNEHYRLMDLYAEILSVEESWTLQRQSIRVGDASNTEQASI